MNWTASEQWKEERFLQHQTPTGWSREVQEALKVSSVAKQIGKRGGRGTKFKEQKGGGKYSCRQLGLMEVKY